MVHVAPAAIVPPANVARLFTVLGKPVFETAARHSTAIRKSHRRPAHELQVITSSTGTRSSYRAIRPVVGKPSPVADGNREGTGSSGRDRSRSRSALVIVKAWTFKIGRSRGMHW